MRECVCEKGKSLNVSLKMHACICIEAWKMIQKKCMTIKTIERALKRSRPSIVKENGKPRFVILDWETYSKWEEMKEDLEDTARLAEALVDPKNKKSLPLSRVKKILHLP